VVHGLTLRPLGGMPLVTSVVFTNIGSATRGAALAEAGPDGR
jgi:hypothetical protein